MADDFPAVYGACKAAGIDPATELIPVAPAAHYHMGGVWTDSMGRTSVDQLWACGEVACTGVHGANRLASNSLLEAVVMGARIARDIARFAPGWRMGPGAVPATEARRAREAFSVEAIARLRETMSRHVGMERSRDGLIAALHDLDALADGQDAPTNAIAAARLITVSALLRTESRGSHRRSDHPAPDESWRRHSLLTLGRAEAIAADATREGGEVVRLSA
jgi:L-aspartate oxidase